MEESRGISSQFLGNLSGRAGNAPVTDNTEAVIILRSSDPIIQHAVSDAVKTMKYFGFLRKSNAAKAQQSHHADQEQSHKLRSSMAELREQSQMKESVPQIVFPLNPRYGKPQTKFVPFAKERDHLGKLLPINPNTKKRGGLSTFEMSSGYNLQKNTSFLEVGSFLNGPKLRLGSKYFQLNPDANLRLKAHIAASRDNSPVVQFEGTQPVESLAKSVSESQNKLLSLQTTPKRRRHKSEISFHVELPRGDSAKDIKDSSKPKVGTHDPQSQVRRLLDYSSPAKSRFTSTTPSRRFASVITKSFESNHDGGLILKTPPPKEVIKPQESGEISFKPIQAFSPAAKRRRTVFSKVSKSEHKLAEVEQVGEPVKTERDEDSVVDADVSFKADLDKDKKLPELRNSEVRSKSRINEASKSHTFLMERPDLSMQDWNTMPTNWNLDNQVATREPSLASGTNLTNSEAKVMIVPRKQPLKPMPDSTPIGHSPFLDGKLGTKFDYKTKDHTPIDNYFQKQEKLQAGVKNTTNYIMKEPSQSSVDTKSIAFKLLQLEKENDDSATPLDTMTYKDLEYLQAEVLIPDHEVQPVRACKNLGVIPMMTPMEIEQLTRARVKTLGRAFTRENIEERKKRQLGKSRNEIDTSQHYFKGKAVILN